MPRACRWRGSTGCCSPRRWRCRTCSPPPASPPSRSTISTSPACSSRPCSAGARRSCSTPRFGREGPLWPHIRARAGRAPGRAAARSSPWPIMRRRTSFFETILSGPLDGRRKLLERLGAEARDPIEELLSSALEFESNAARLAPGLPRLVRARRRRDRPRSFGAARRGAGDDRARRQGAAVAGGDPGRRLRQSGQCRAGRRASPGSGSRRGRRSSPPSGRARRSWPSRSRARSSAQDRLDREEHWRLLYVALTRAEERLYIGGALGARDRGGPAEASWYRAVETALAGLGSDWARCAALGRATCASARSKCLRGRPPKAAEREQLLPDWLHRPAPAEERPPRPLAPSSLGEDDVADPPPGPEQRAGGACAGGCSTPCSSGCPGVGAGTAQGAGRALAGASRPGMADAALRAALADDACRIIADPALRRPVRARRAGRGADRGGGGGRRGRLGHGRPAARRATTASSSPTSRPAAARRPTLADIPAAHLRQMAAYRAALRVIFPGRPVEAALLYTAAPVLHRAARRAARRACPPGG